MAKRRTAQARIDDDLRTDFDWALEYTGLGETQFLEACIKSLVEIVREKGEITLPLAIIAKSREKGASSTAPPEKAPASGTQRTVGRKDAEAAHGESRSTGFPPTSPKLNEDAPREIKPAIPARAPAGPRARSTRGIKNVNKKS